MVSLSHSNLVCVLRKIISGSCGIFSVPDGRGGGQFLLYYIHPELRIVTLSYRRIISAVSDLSQFHIILCKIHFTNKISSMD